jgi:hypothetical protein
MQGRALGLVVAVALGGTASAGKPTDAQARKATSDWIAAMHFDKSAPLDAAKLVATPFFAVAYSDAGATCAEATATKPDDLSKALACLQDHLAPKGRPKVWTHKSTQNLGGPLHQHARRIDALRKTATLVELDEGCDGTENDVILAVTKDAKMGARVVAVFAQTVTCDE